MGVLQPTQGEILIDDHPTKQVSDYRRQIAGVMQDDQLLGLDKNYEQFNFEEI